MSRERLAALAGVSPRTIFAIEVEGVRPQRATRHVLCDALGVPEAEIFPVNDERPAGNQALDTTSAGGDGRNAGHRSST